MAGPSRLLDTLKATLDNKLLDWAEMLPKFDRGPIADLQMIRRHQRDWSRRFHGVGRLPDGMKFRYASCVLMEFFPIEESPALEAAVSHLFPSQWPSPHPAEKERTLSPSLQTRGSRNLGLMVRESRSFAATPIFIARHLPPTVRYIAVELHSVLPSASIVCFEAHLTEEATTRIQRLLDTDFLSRVRFRKWVPLGSYRTSRSEELADSVKHEAVLSEFAQLRIEIEEVVCRHFKGFFTKQPKAERPRLPAIELLSLEGLPPADPDGPVWPAEIRGWAEALNIDGVVLGIEGYRSGDDLIIPGGKSIRGSFDVAHRVLILSRSPAAWSDQDVRSVGLYRGLVPSVASLVAVLEFLSRVRDAVEKLRRRVYGRLAGASLLLAFRRDLKLYEEVQRLSLLLNRLMLETDGTEWYLKHIADELRSFTAFREDLRGKTLGEALLEALRRQSDALSKHVEFVSGSFLAHIQTRNVDLTYRLQWATYLAALAAAVLGFFAGWPAIRDLVRAGLALVKLYK